MFYGRQNEAFKDHWLPITYALLCSYVDREKVEIVVIDERIEKENTWKLIDTHAPQSIFFGISSATGYQLARSIKAARYVKEHFSDVPIVWGGPHVTALTKQSLDENYVDYAIVGRGDEILPELIEDIKHKRDSRLPGVFYMKEGTVWGQPNGEARDLNQSPEWPYDLFKISEYINPRTKAINLTTSWGCENRCTFCYWYNNYNPWSGFTADRVMNEVDRFQEDYGIKNIYFLESDYFGSVSRAMEIAQRLKGRGILYRTNSRVTHMGKMGPKDFKLLDESGCYSIHIGLETGSPKMLRLMSKNINLDNMLQAAKDARDTGIHLCMALLFQIPGETVEDLRLTHRFVEQLKAVNPNIRLEISSFILLPNLPLTRLAEKHGYVSPSSMEEWSKNLLVKKNEYEEKPWMTRAESIEYHKVYQELFPESQSMHEVHENLGEG